MSDGPVRSWLVLATAIVAIVWGVTLGAQHVEAPAAKPSSTEAKPTGQESQGGKVSIAPQLGRIAPSVSPSPPAPSTPSAGKTTEHPLGPPESAAGEKTEKKKPAPSAAPDRMNLQAAVDRIEKRLAEAVDLRKTPPEPVRPIAARASRVILNWRTSLVWPAEIAAAPGGPATPAAGRVTLVWP